MSAASLASEVKVHSGGGAGSEDNSAASLAEAVRGAKVMLVEDDPGMARYLTRAVRRAGPETVRAFPEAVSAMAELGEGAELPDLLVLDVLLTGPNGFALLNELISYPDTAAIPVILVSTLALEPETVAHYGVRRVLNKQTMRPEEVVAAVREALAT